MLTTPHIIVLSMTPSHPGAYGQQSSPKPCDCHHCYWQLVCGSCAWIQRRFLNQHNSFQLHQNVLFWSHQSLPFNSLLVYPSGLWQTFILTTVLFLEHNSFLHTIQPYTPSWGVISSTGTPSIWQCFNGPSFDISSHHHQICRVSWIKAAHTSP